MIGSNVSGDCGYREKGTTPLPHKAHTDIPKENRRGKICRVSNRKGKSEQSQWSMNRRRPLYQVEVKLGPRCLFPEGRMESHG